MGTLVGVTGYSRISLPLPIWLPFAITILAIAAPVALVALRSEMIVRNRAALVGALAGPVVLLGMVALAIYSPMFSRAFGVEGAGPIFLIVVLLAPAAGAFTMTVLTPQPAPADDLRRHSTGYALFAWAGIGVQNLALPYLAPAARVIWYHAIGQGGPPRASAWQAMWLGVALIATIAWLLGFALAAAEGALVARLFNLTVVQQA